MTKLNLKLFTLAMLQGISLSVFADEIVDNTAPAINPQRECQAEGMINPPGKNYRYLYSNDCRVVHVLPPETIPQEIRGEGIGLRACLGLRKLEDTINHLETTIEEATGRSKDLLDKAGQTASPREAQALRKRADAERETADVARKEVLISQERLQKTYGRAPGAKFAIVLKSDIDARDLNELRALNDANLNRPIQIDVVKDGKPAKETVYQRSSLRPAKIGQSVFSLLYKVPENVDTNGGVIRTNIPGLQYLEQDKQEGVIHVKASGGITGELIMSQQMACEHAKPDNTGNYVLDNDVDPFFIVNRTFTVQQVFAQGYHAVLLQDKAADQITKTMTTNTDQGFQKSSVFNPSLMVNIDQLVKWEWTQGWDNGKSYSPDQLLELKKSVLASLVDDYIEKLKNQGIIEIKKDPGTSPAVGGLVDETRSANRCWTERDGGLSGIFGRRHTVCGDYTYTVKVWKDGVSQDEVNRHFQLSTEVSETMQMNMMAPFTFSTTFTK